MSAPSTDEAVCIDCQPENVGHAPPASAAAVQKEDLLDPTTFVPPLSASSIAGLPSPLVVIEVSLHPNPSFPKDKPY